MVVLIWILSILNAVLFGWTAWIAFFGGWLFTVPGSQWEYFPGGNGMAGVVCLAVGLGVQWLLLLAHRTKKQG
jgi:hypothetical protein